MSTSAWYLDEMRPEELNSQVNADQYRRDDFAAFAAGLVSGERVGAPLQRGSSRAWRRGVFCSTIAALAASAYFGMTSARPWQVPSWLGDAVASAWSSLQPDVRATNATPLPAPPLAMQPLEASEVAARGISAGEPTASAPDAGAIPPADAAQAESDSPAESDTAVVAAPLPPPKIDAADPYQKKAVAVGLHPDLSRVLLARMTAVDYRNAGVAITKALTESGDGEVLVWPREATAKLAMFEVQFVPGAAPDCRRYVVRVTKDGWLTTALPMEKCGVKAKNNLKEPKRAQEPRSRKSSVG